MSDMKESITHSHATTFVAFLRGVNVGGHKRVGMEELRKTFELLGFQNVRTLLASGNVIFETPGADTAALVRRIEAKLERTFRSEIGVIVRTVEEIQNLVDSRPFEGVPVAPSTRLYVTFLSENPGSSLEVPYVSPGGDLTILRLTTSEACSVLTLSPGRGTTDLMTVLERNLGPKITTRNWNTVTRLLKR